MKSLGLIAMVVIAGWCVSCEHLNAQTPAPTSEASTEPASGTPAAPSAPASTPPVPSPPPVAATPPAPKPAGDPNLLNEAAYKNAHLSTPAGDSQSPTFPALREFLEDSQNAHDKLIVDRFLIGVAVLFAVIAAALLFSLPPKPREQKE